MNVAVSRARRFLAIVCDTATVCKASGFIAGLVSHVTENGLVPSPLEFLTKGEISSLFAFLENVDAHYSRVAGCRRRPATLGEGPWVKIFMCNSCY